MKWSHTGVKTLREAPADASLPSHALLVRAGFIHKLSSGIFTYSPLMLRSINKLQTLIREELNLTGCAEILMPMVQSKEIWQQSGRWELYQGLLQKITNRQGREFCLGPTHEEVVSLYGKALVKSYKDLPFTLYQIQTKFRDEIRPRFGLLRAKEFIMKDAYSFDTDEGSAQKSYQKMRQVYQNIFSKAGVDFRIVAADSGEIGGSLSEEFHILAQNGEDELLVAENFATNKNREEFKDTKEGDPAPKGGTFKSFRGIEVGHIFYLGEKYSHKMGVFYLDRQGQKQAVQMGCYGIGVSRTLQATIEQNFDKEGMVWPASLAPFRVHICLLDPQDTQSFEKAHTLYHSLWESGIDSFLDDRKNLPPGVKFKDADLMGFPLRVDIGSRNKNSATLVQRKTKEKTTLPHGEVLKKITSLLETEV